MTHDDVSDCLEWKNALKIQKCGEILTTDVFLRKVGPYKVAIVANNPKAEILQSVGLLL